jgi:hypothetical protein
LLIDFQTQSYRIVKPWLSVKWSAAGASHEKLIRKKKS